MSNNLFENSCKVIDDQPRLPALSLIVNTVKNDSGAIKLNTNVASKGFYEFFTGFCGFDNCRLLKQGCKERFSGTSIKMQKDYPW